MGEKEKKTQTYKYLGIACCVLLIPLITELFLCLIFRMNFIEILNSEFNDGFFFMCSISLIAPIIYTLDYVINTKYIENKRKYPILPSIGLLFFCGIFYAYVKMGKILDLTVSSTVIIVLSVVTTAASLIIAFQLRMIEMDKENPEAQDPNQNRKEHESAIESEMKKNEVSGEIDRSKKKGIEGKLDLDDNEMGDE